MHGCGLRLVWSSWRKSGLCKFALEMVRLTRFLQIDKYMVMELPLWLSNALAKT